MRLHSAFAEFILTYCALAEDQTENHYKTIIEAFHTATAVRNDARPIDNTHLHSVLRDLLKANPRKMGTRLSALLVKDPQHGLPIVYAGLYPLDYLGMHAHR